MLWTVHWKVLTASFFFVLLLCLKLLGFVCSLTVSKQWKKRLILVGWPSQNCSWGLFFFICGNWRQCQEIYNNLCWQFQPTHFRVDLELSFEESVLVLWVIINGTCNAAGSKGKGFTLSNVKCNNNNNSHVWSGAIIDSMRFVLAKNLSYSLHHFDLVVMCSLRTNNSY